MRLACMILAALVALPLFPESVQAGSARTRVAPKYYRETVVYVEITPEGIPQNAYVISPSGNDNWDRKAVYQVMNRLHNPVIIDGQAVYGWRHITINGKY